MGWDLSVYSGNKEEWKKKEFDCFAEYHCHFGSPAIDLLLTVLDISPVSTKNIKEDEWEGLDYEGITTLSKVTTAKQKIEHNDPPIIPDGLSDETKNKIIVFLSEVIISAETEELYLDWG